MNEAGTRGARVRSAGDSALLLELGSAIDEGVNALAVAVAASVRRAGIAGVRDVVSTYRSVAVFFDPLATDPGEVAAALSAASLEPASVHTGATIEVPVSYGGDCGPDLGNVASHGGLSNEGVIDRHTSRPYRVFMLGFLPGFPYMGIVDDAIAAPRRSTPRVRVPAGSVGIAGWQTGIYPQSSPGGWQIIGRTSVKLFDPQRTEPFLLAPGDSVRFVPARGIATSDTDGQPTGRHAETPTATRHVAVIAPGLFTTIQDLGRWGHQRQGVPVSGSMDSVALRLANALVGNTDRAAAIEATVLGPKLRMEQDGIVAVAGADLGATLDGHALPRHTAVPCRSGSVIGFGERVGGARAYIAFDGGVATPPVLGSRATHALSGLGGLDGRAFRTGDRVPLGTPSGDVRALVDHSLVRTIRGGVRLRVLPGPQDDRFKDSAFEAMQSSRYVVSPQADRMGYRLTGPRLPRLDLDEMISDATFAGSIQVPPSGQPILLMADRQTTGGYPQIATVISADLSLAGQLAPGDWVEFTFCSRAEALAALEVQEGLFRGLG